ncbi:MAG: undecaprenyl/decaprenyl-phosphate alpha-N-acetylglucosaminyl 1-phosphate transferase, partial [Planctomycetaceae bacterium]|nr:undecaprenyl/decaprenyl-phosphate alpha-N-acetylglucosaminyl 1-phosphate transferase [Planctomycetaceae bacterium]
LLGQFVAATVLIYFGYRFDIVSVFGLHFKQHAPAIYILVAYAWILIGINSVNLLDGADGFATTIGIVTSVALCVMALGLAFQIPFDVDSLSQQNQRATHFRDAIVCAAMASALMAFLKFNFPPATAFLGDAGSMLIGLFIAAMAIKSGAKQALSYAFLAPIALLAIPMFDTLAAILRRKLTGRSIYDTDRGHLHHALMGKGFGPRKSLLLFFAMCLMTATGGTMALIYKQAEYAALAILSVAVFLFVGRIFGMAEFRLVSHHSKSAFRSLLVKPKKTQYPAEHSSIRLQGERDWDLCWQVLREFAEKHHVSQMTFDLNLPWIHESFHAQYKTTDKKKSELEERWQLELPLTANQRSIGRLNVQACVN